MSRLPKLEPDQLSDDQKRVVAELHRDHQVSDDTFAAVHAALGSEQIVELVVLCGHYNVISMVLNGFDVQVPGGERPLS